MIQVSKKQIPRFVGLLLTTFSIIFLVITLLSHMESLPALKWDSTAMLALVGAVLLGAFNLMVFSQIWRIIVNTHISTLTPMEGLVIYTKANIAKYIPGNVFQFVGRYTLAKRYGVETDAVFLSLAVESMVMISAAVLLAIPGIYLTGAEVPEVGRLTMWPWLLAGSLAGMAIAGWFRKKIMEWLRRAKRFLDPKRLGVCLLLNLAIFAFYGISISLIYQYVWESPGGEVSWLQFSWGYAAGWLAGYLVPGSPGGVGVREAVLYAIFNPLIGAGMAAALFILVRVVSILSDGLAYGIGIYASRRTSKMDEKVVGERV